MTFYFDENSLTPSTGGSGGGGGGDTPTKYGMTINDVFGDVDSNGALQYPTTPVNITFNGVESINTNYILQRKFQSSPNIRNVSFPDLTTVSGSYCLDYSFASSSLTSLEMPNLISISGSYSMCQMCANCASLTNINLNDLETIGSNGLASAFQNSSITSFNLPNLHTVGSTALYGVCSGCSQLTTVDLSGVTSLTDILSLQMGFYDCPNLSSVNLSHLTTITGGSDYNGQMLLLCFGNDINLTSIDLSSLEKINSYCAMARCFESSGLTSITFDNLYEIKARAVFSECFSNCPITSISFPALTSTSFGTYTNQFTNMLQNVNGCTVHFPYAIESVIGNWNDILGGFGGTNTTVLFDIGACVVTFNLNPNTNNTISIDSNVLTDTSTILTKNSNVEYAVVNSSYGAYVNLYNVPDEDTANLSIDMTQLNYNTVTFNVGVSGLTITCTIDGCEYICSETSSGFYTLPICNSTGNNINVSYFINGGDLYHDVSDVVVVLTSDISLTITLTPMVDVNFVRPNLTSNGTMGKNAFAVDMASSQTYRSMAYNAVSSNTSFSVQINANDCWYDFYNPDALKISELVCKFKNGSVYPTEMSLQGSNDGGNWENVANWSGTGSANITFSVNSTKYYKYHRLTFVISGSYTKLLDLGITATYKG